VDHSGTALLSDGNGGVYVGGLFTIAGGVSASRIAYWEGGAWSALGDGVQGTVQALAPVPTAPSIRIRRRRCPRTTRSRLP
jgi:hypothetical protein